MRVDRRTALGLLAGAPVLAATPAHAMPAPAFDVAPSMPPKGPWTDSGTVAVGGGVLHWDAIGPVGGDPLILLHKLGGWTADWRHIAPMLAQGRRVIAFDIPGHGASKMSGDAPWMLSVPQISAMLLHALDDLDIDRFDLLGNSIGGIVGILLAALWPDRVKSLGLISVSLIDRMPRAVIAQQDIDRAKEGGVLGMKAFGTLVPSVTEEQIAGRAAAGPWLRACERGVGHVGVTDYLPRIAAPTLLIHADRGQYVRHTNTGMRLIPNCRAVGIAGAGSFVHQEKPVETAAAVNAFLTR